MSGIVTGPALSRVRRKDVENINFDPESLVPYGPPCIITPRFTSIDGAMAKIAFTPMEGGVMQIEVECTLPYDPRPEVSQGNMRHSNNFRDALDGVIDALLNVAPPELVLGYHVIPPYIPDTPHQCWVVFPEGSPTKRTYRAVKADKEGNLDAEHIDGLASRTAPLPPIITNLTDWLYGTIVDAYPTITNKGGDPRPRITEGPSPSPGDNPWL